MGAQTRTGQRPVATAEGASAGLLVRLERVQEGGAGAADLAPRAGGVSDYVEAAIYGGLIAAGTVLPANLPVGERKGFVGHFVVGAVVVDLGDVIVLKGDLEVGYAGFAGTGYGED